MWERLSVRGCLLSFRNETGLRIFGRSGAEVERPTHCIISGTCDIRRTSLVTFTSITWLRSCLPGSVPKVTVTFLCSALPKRVTMTSL